MGAVLCRAYQEPLVPPSGTGERPHRPPPRFLHDFRFANWGAGHADVEYLMRYPILNFEAYEKHGPVYGPLADFLFQQSKTRAQSQYHSQPENLVSAQEATIPDYMDETHASILYTETVGSLFAFLTLSDKPFQSVIFKDPRGDESKNSRLNRKITVVPLDWFHPMEIFMPGQAQDAHHTLLYKMPTFSSNYYYTCVPQILTALYARSGQPNHFRPGYRTPWPPLQIFEFILRKFLGLCFDQLFFSTFYDQGVAFFVRDSGDIYHEDYSQWPVGACWVFGGVDGEYNGYDSYFAPMN